MLLINNPKFAEVTLYKLRPFDSYGSGLGGDVEESWAEKARSSVVRFRQKEAASEEEQRQKALGLEAVSRRAVSDEAEPREERKDQGSTPDGQTRKGMKCADRIQRRR
ncbi:hypothetical protein NDU88_007356 [Pleurodeles waltl]|uniref:Uncharacterized protein n=1 Tax=Pleurodeles waltl TaxID=8319 RepID=A0AAV7RPA1_PLEWA|nr:hypothetical protein NDU88_007356 [Pleurodeles waltl]